MKTRKPAKKAPRKARSRKLHINQLTAINACTEQVERFRKLFGDSVNVTEALCKKHFDKFDWGFASKLLSPEGRAEYNRVRGLARAEYNRVHGLALAEYDRVTGPAWAEYDRVRDLARAEYDRVCGLAWARLYIAEGGK
jgi:hypothetical protein